MPMPQPAITSQFPPKPQPQTIASSQNTAWPEKPLLPSKAQTNWPEKPAATQIVEVEHKHNPFSISNPFPQQPASQEPVQKEVDLLGSFDLLNIDGPSVSNPFSVQLENQDPPMHVYSTFQAVPIESRSVILAQQLNPQEVWDTALSQEKLDE